MNGFVVTDASLAPEPRTGVRREATLGGAR